MKKVKQINIKNWTYYVYNDIIDLKTFKPNSLKIGKKPYKNIDIYFIGYIPIKNIDDYESIYSVNPLYVRINHASGYIEEKNENKYLIFDSVDENREVLKKYADVWDGIKTKIKAINGGEENLMQKIKFNSENDLPLNKPLTFHATTIIIRSVFKEDGKLYPQLFFRWHFALIIKMLPYEKLMF